MDWLNAVSGFESHEIIEALDKYFYRREISLL
jgi:hypothetical protein